ncbi:hypothetical protein B0H66DRAFT_176271 [Apodospora peruviana]|uniref:Microbial-type PARG catalytic domain-containing protein n=1 Tax=Apodospora peruviana TaxID=516989 RepID=A0AAE0IB08_9PEZI|nr:hypothetical protein B0H66DRAFT_176271 [Apodospora peruviana]
MPSGSSSKSSKPKPSEVASETKKHYIPLIKKHYAEQWRVHSFIIQQPLLQLNFLERPVDVSPPVFAVYHGDPVDFALGWAAQVQLPIPFICAANDKRAGGDWETGVLGYEERLCRRSTLAANLVTPGPDSRCHEHYPIPSTGAIVSPQVVVFRGPHEKYEKLPPDQWKALPVVSVTPTRWPKLTQNGTKYSFADERELVREKMRGALRICAYNEYTHVVIGDFGLGNGYRNPPQEFAELWREVFLYDPDLRGRIACVAFVFEDPKQSTTQLIQDDIAKKSSKSSKSSSSGSSSNSKSSSSSSSYPTDHAIFAHVFSGNEIQRVLGQPDSRYGLNNLLA